MLNECDLKRIGIHEYGLISPAEIVFEPEIRKMCEDNVCRLYGTSWACPPAVGTVEECRRRCFQYADALVFNAVYALEDSFDYEGMVKGHDAFKVLCSQLYALAKAQRRNFLLLSNEGGGRCRECTYPSAPCRKPELLFPALEGFGINVAKLAASGRMKYTHDENTVTYFGMLLY